MRVDAADGTYVDLDTSQEVSVFLLTPEYAALASGKLDGSRQTREPIIALRDLSIRTRNGSSMQRAAREKDRW